jgi:phosphatidylglycerophosphatase A
MFRRWIVTFGGAGLLPAMPGTFGSLAAAIVFYLLCLVFRENVRWIVPALLVIAGAVGIALGRWAEDYFKAVDPRQFVLDEVVGQWLTLLFVPLSALRAHTLPSIAAAFFLFRAFDVAKPFPIRRIERLSGGWGIVLDDVAAAAYAGVSFLLLRYVVTATLGQGR